MTDTPLNPLLIEGTAKRTGCESPFERGGRKADGVCYPGPERKIGDMTSEL